MPAPRHPGAARAWLVAVLASLSALSACTLDTAAVPQVVPADGSTQPPSASPGLSTGPAPAAPSPPARSPLLPPRVGARSVVVENLVSGAVLYAKGDSVRHPIASLSKIMTAMLVLGRTDPTDMVTTTKQAAKQVPTKLGLKPGDRMEVGDLLYALLLHSSNDVAVALAQHVSGTVKAFDALMTTKGQRIGMDDTWFASPSGLNDKGYSTASDVADMTRWAYRSQTFADIVATKRYSIRMPSGQTVKLRNLNDLLFDYPGAIGVKTGYTSQAHWSLVGVAERGQARMLVVLLDDPKEPFADGQELLDWAFAREASFVGGGAA